MKKKLKDQKVTLGTWVTIPSCENVEVISHFAFDWLTIDMEHSAITIDQVQQLVRTIKAFGLPVLVRVGENNENLIKRVMDTGANGVIVPMVKTKEDAEKAVAFVKYPPEGVRGVGFGRAQKFGLEFDKYKKWLKEESIVIVIIEHIDAMDHLEEILSVDGVDGSMIGPYDLSGSIGYPGEIDREEVVSLVEKYKAVCKKIDKPAGYHVVVPDVEKLKEKMAEGYKFLAFSTDALFLANSIEGKIESLKND